MVNGSYLFRIELEEELSETDFNALMVESGMKLVKEEDSLGYKSFYYEINSEQGCTKSHVLLSPVKPKVKDFSVRFSLPCSHFIVNQTFDFLSKVSRKKAFRVFDTEIRSFLYAKLKKEEPNAVKYQRLIEDNKSEIEKQCYIHLDSDSFIKNELNLEKRNH